MTPSARVCVVVLNWDQPAMTRRCLDHVRASTGVTFDVLVIDNGSKPENRAQLERECGGECELVLLPANLGFAGGMNRGIERALARGHEFVWLLNNDAFPEPNCLARLVGAMDADSSLGAVTPRLTDERGGLQHVGTEMDARTGGLQLLYELDAAVAKRAGVTLTGAAFLLRVAALKQVGAFDERFFAYWEDVDLGLRMRRAGWAIAVVAEAACVHNEGGTSGGERSPLVRHLYARNRWLVLRKLRPPRARLQWLSRQVARVLIEAGHEALAGRRANAVGTLTGLWAGLGRRYGRPTPAQIRRESTVTRAVLARPFHFSNALTRLADGLDRCSACKGAM